MPQSKKTRSITEATKRRQSKSRDVTIENFLHECIHSDCRASASNKCFGIDSNRSNLDPPYSLWQVLSMQTPLARMLEGLNRYDTSDINATDGSLLAADN